MRTVAVTGSASGLGAAVRRRLERDGCRVIGVDRRDAEVIADLSAADGRQRALAGVLDASGGVLDGAVSCAGLGPDEEPAPILRVNFFGALAVLDGLRDALARGDEPAAVGIASVAGLFDVLARSDVLEACHAGDEKRAVEAVAGLEGTFAYGNAKRALAQAIRRRAAEWGALGVRLNAVAPGSTETPMLERLMADPVQGAAVRSLPVPLGRFGPADEVAAAVCFLLGPDAGYVHGHVLVVDGGSDAALRPDVL